MATVDFSGFTPSRGHGRNSHKRAYGDPNSHAKFRDQPGPDGLATREWGSSRAVWGGSRGREPGPSSADTRF